jgi:SAM-dependent methyltransferase
MKNIYKEDFFRINTAWNLVKKSEVEKLVKYSESNENVLEIGLGNGFTTGMLSKYFKQVIAVDISENVIELVKKNLIERKNIVYIKSSIDNLDIESRIYNFYLGHILEHLQFPVRSLRSLRKILNKNSVGYISVPNSNSIHRQMGVVMGLLDSTDMLNDNDIKVGHKRLYTLKKLKNHIRKAGFDISRVGGCFLKIMTYSQIDKFFSEELIRGFIEIADGYPEISGDIYAIVKKSK